MLYASSQRLGCYLETLARFRVDLTLYAELSEIEGEDDFTPLGRVPLAWATGWCEFDVTSPVNTEAMGDDVITFCVTNNSSWWNISPVRARIHRNSSSSTAARRSVPAGRAIRHRQTQKQE